jgi:nucleoside diphosphate kinase
MIPPYTLLIIKPMTVGRGHAAEILEEILSQCPVSLRLFRDFRICDTTLLAVCQSTRDAVSNLDYDQEKIHPPRQQSSWIGLFTHIDRLTDPTQILEDYCGPLEPAQWKPHHLRYKYGGQSLVGVTAHPSDTVVHISKPARANYESSLLFQNFNEDTL